MKYFLSRGYVTAFALGSFFSFGWEAERSIALKVQPHNFRLIVGDITVLQYRDSNTAESSFISSNCYLYQNCKVITPEGRDERQAPG